MGPVLHVGSGAGPQSGRIRTGQERSHRDLRATAGMGTHRVSCQRLWQGFGPRDQATEENWMRQFKVLSIDGGGIKGLYSAESESFRSRPAAAARRRGEDRRLYRPDLRHVDGRPDRAWACLANPRGNHLRVLRNEGPRNLQRIAGAFVPATSDLVERQVFGQATARRVAGAAPRTHDGGQRVPALHSDL